MSVRRVAVAASVAALSFATFAGCTEDAPSPTPTAADGCSPTSAIVSFSPGSKAGSSVVAAYVLRYSPDSQAWETSGVTPVRVDPVWDDDDLSDLVSTASGRRVWERALLARANRTGQATGPFGDASTLELPADSPSHPAHPSRATYVATLSVPRLTLPFTVNCPQSERALTGSVTAPVYVSLTSRLYHCGVVATTDDARVARGFCP